MIQISILSLCVLCVLVRLNHSDAAGNDITSQVSSSPKVGDIIIADWRSAGLLKASMIKPVITTIEKQHDPQKIGKASRCRYPVSERGIDWNYR